MFIGIEWIIRRLIACDLMAKNAVIMSCELELMQCELRVMRWMGFY